MRLTVGGKSYTQPLTLRLDPRVKTPAVSLATLNSLTREMYDGAKAARAAADQARALMTQLDAVQDADVSAFKEKLASLAPPQAGGGRGGRGGGGAGGAGGGRGGAATGAAPATLESVSASMLAAAMAMQAADVAPTAREVSACADARRQAAAVMARWTQLKTVDLPALNAKRTSAGEPPITIPKA